MTNDICFFPIERTLAILEGKWTILILRELFAGPQRYGALKRELEPISPRILTDRLRLLEMQGIVSRTLYAQVPLHVEYALTEQGQRLRPILEAMAVWATSEAQPQPS